MIELEMMSLLDHTNIVQIVDGYEDKKRLCIVMELYPLPHTSDVCLSAFATNCVKISSFDL